MSQIVYQDRDQHLSEVEIGRVSTFIKTRVVSHSPPIPVNAQSFLKETSIQTTPLSDTTKESGKIAVKVQKETLTATRHFSPRRLVAQNQPNLTIQNNVQSKVKSGKRAFQKIMEFNLSGQRPQEFSPKRNVYIPVRTNKSPVQVSKIVRSLEKGNFQSSEITTKRRRESRCLECGRLIITSYACCDFCKRKNQCQRQKFYQKKQKQSKFDSKPKESYRSYNAFSPSYDRRVYPRTDLASRKRYGYI